MAAKKLSSGIVVVRFFPDGPRYLLLRAYNYWDFPKGEVAADEDPFSAACREVAEETTLEGLRFAWGKKFCETPPYGKGKIARYYLAESTQGEVDLPVSPELGRPEHHEFRWATYLESRKLLVARLQTVLDWARRHVVEGRG